jgi:outer membrane protein assembly factor BamB
MNTERIRAADSLDRWWDAYQRGEIDDGIPTYDMNLIQEITAMHAHAISSADEQRIWRQTRAQIKSRHDQSGGSLLSLLHVDIPRILPLPNRRWFPAKLQAAAVLAIVVVSSVIINSMSGGDGPRAIFEPVNSTRVATSAPTMSSDVPMYRSNPERTGVNPGPGPAEEPTVMWQASLGGVITHEPILVNGVIYIDDNSGNIHAFDARTGEMRWQISTGTGGSSALAAGDGIIYATAYDGSLRALSAETGEEVWRDDRATVNAPATVLGNQIVLNSPNGMILTLNAATGAEQDQFSIAEPFLTLPAIEDGVIYGGAFGGNVYAYELATHSELWRADSGVDALAPVTVADGLVLVPGVGQTERGGVVALEATTGEERWHFIPADGLIMGSVTIADGLVYLSANNGTIHAINLADGTTAWTESYGNEGFGDSAVFAARSSPVFAAGALYVAGTDGTLLATAGLQNEIWHTTLPAAIVAGPIVADGMLWVGTVDGTIYALGSPGAPISPVGADASASPVATPGPGEMEVEWTASGGRIPLIVPQHVGIDLAGNAYVIDPGNERIVVFGPDGAYVKELGESGQGPGQFQFSQPGWAFGSVDVDVSGAIYVSDTHNHRIQKFDSDGAYLLDWGSIGVGDGQLNLPGGILVANEQVYVADYGNNRIQVFTTDGAFVAAWGSFGNGEGEFRGPAGLAVDSNGNIYVSEWLGARIQVFTAEGAYIGQIGKPGDFGAIPSVAIDEADTLIVADYENSRVLVYNADGERLAVYDRLDSGEQVLGPSGIAILSDGSVYLAEEGRDRLLKVRIPEVTGGE